MPFAGCKSMLDGQSKHFIGSHNSRLTGMGGEAAARKFPFLWGTRENPLKNGFYVTPLSSGVHLLSVHTL
jgi:hypothetical protein